MRTPGAPYVEFDKSETQALAKTRASADIRGAPPTPPGKGGGNPWDGPIVRQTDLESGASASD